MRKVQISLMAALFAIMIALGGCAAMGGVQPQNAQQSLYTADAQFSALTETTTDLMNQGVITGSAAVKANHYMHVGDAALTAAWKAVGTGGKPSASTLSTVANASMEINSILQQYAKQVKSHG